MFTHLTQVQAEAYLAELSRGAANRAGSCLTSWFVFDKRDFPMMQEDQNTLFINEFDVRNAVIYDRSWTRGAPPTPGLLSVTRSPPGIRGHQWELRMTQPGTGIGRG